MFLMPTKCHDFFVENFEEIIFEILMVLITEWKACFSSRGTRNLEKHDEKVNF